jgi:hypothetical protein
MVQFKVNDVQVDVQQVSYLIPSAPNGQERAMAMADGKAIDGFSHDGATFLTSRMNRDNPLLAAVYLAFSYHLPLVLSPDVIWNTILQGVSTHVATDPEKHRHAFVSHKDKEVLTVRDDSLVRGSPNNDWGRIACTFTELIGAKLSGVAAIKALNTRFSTTDEMARVAHAIVFMDVVKSYFEYRVMTMCGIPTIELTGTKDDWQRLRKALALLDDLDLAVWRKQLDTILAHFEDAFERRVDQSFWNGIFLEHGGRGSGVETTVSGWLGSLFLYTASGQLNPGAMGKAGVRLAPSAFPTGRSETPFEWDYHGQKFPMLLRGGLVGVIVDPVSYTVTPQLGWLVTDAEKSAPTSSNAREQFSAPTEYITVAREHNLAPRVPNAKENKSVPKRSSALWNWCHKS